MRRHQRGQALILIFLGTLLVGGAAGGLHGLFDAHERKQIAARLDAMAIDPVRRDALDVTLVAIEREVQHFQAERALFEQDAFDALAKHDAPAATYDLLFARADTVSAASTHTLLDLRFQLRQQLTAEQWRQLFAPASK